MTRVRPGRADQADALTALCIRSKAHWGYDSEFMRQAATALTVTPAMIEEGRVLVAEDPDGSVSGVVAVAAADTAGKFDLTLLFVEPSAIRMGVGRTLFNAAVRLVEQQGGSSLSILADPFAAEFYQHLGAIRIGEAPSDSIPGRYLPLFDYVISQSCGQT
jgi:GNAT superfamily N-acetyltransferase